MKIAIVGAGAMGSLFGAKLSDVAQVTLLDPWREHVAAIRRDGLRITALDGREVTVQVAATDDPDEVDPVDLAIIFVKSHQTEMAARWTKRFLQEDGLALTLQNGVGNAQTIAGVLGWQRTCSGVTSHGATLLGPGRVRHAGQGPTHLSTRPEIANRVEAVVSPFRQAGFEVHLSADLDGLVWGKLVINVGINALTAILRVPNGALVEIEAGGALMASAVAEAVQIAAAKGIALPYPDPLKRVREVCVATAANRSSMLQDVLRGVPTEIDVINGAIVREGQRLGILTPINRFLVQTIKAIEFSYDVRV
ncbi:MAG: 2-dehydropantoate 2-reductase [Chloroflexota bacterium]|nr:2-dehydropantoate 2-reductase [Chloroflexota bacterium]